MKMTFQPKNRQRSKVHGFRARMSTPGGRKVLAARRAKGRAKLSVCIKPLVKNMKRFPSIKKNSDFQKVYRTGNSHANRQLVMYVMRAENRDTRIGISVSKKVGNSIVRHRLTRLIRESFRLHRDILETGLDIVVVARAAAKESDYKTIERAFLHLCGLHNILENRSEKND